MDENEWLAQRFEEHRSHLRSMAYRMLGSLTEADDAVQDTWLRLSRAGASEVENLGGWLTTIIARVCLNMLRSRHARREDSFGLHLPYPIISADEQRQPEEEALMIRSGKWSPNESSRRAWRERNIYRHTRAMIVVNHPPRFSTSLAPARLRRSQVSCTASSASVSDPNIR